MKNLLHLTGWLLLTWVLSIPCVSIWGGVEWPYFFVLLLLPFAACREARRLSVAICYGLIGGFIFAWPIFIDWQMAKYVKLGYRTEIEIFSFTIAMGFVCGMAFHLDKRGEKASPEDKSTDG